MPVTVLKLSNKLYNFLAKNIGFLNKLLAVTKHYSIKRRDVQRPSVLKICLMNALGCEVFRACIGLFNLSNATPMLP